VTSSSRSGAEVAPASVPDTSRWGAPAPLLLRAVAVSAWLALVASLLATALPGSCSGIGPWIPRVETISSLLSQFATLLGASLVVLLVLGTLAERGLAYAYRMIVVPTAAAVVMLVLLASTSGLEPEATLILGLACLALATAGATAAMNAVPSRAQGLVVSLVTLSVATRLAVRVLTMGATHHDASWVNRVAVLATIGEVFDALAVALAAARFRAEQKNRAAVVLLVGLGATLWIAWSAMKGSFDGATTWQVIASRLLAELAQSPITFGTLPSRYALEALAVLLSGVVIFWPARISAGMIGAALAILARPGVDVPAAALVLAVSALLSPLGRTPSIQSSILPGPPAPERRPAGADR
jgi:hypothetical protein